jgi:hypothetical protein
MHKNKSFANSPVVGKYADKTTETDYKDREVRVTHEPPDEDGGWWERRVYADDGTLLGGIRSPEHYGDRRRNGLYYVVTDDWREAVTWLRDRKP